MRLDLLNRPACGSSDDIMSELRRRGLSYPDISAACDVFLGWKLTEEHVRARLHALGTPKLESHARYGNRNGTKP